MKKTAAILLLALLAFNWCGYRFVSGFLESRADEALQSKIEHADYDDTNLIEVRVPLNAPYLSGNSTAFERYDGELEMDGIQYKYVKRKVENGELVLLCLPNDNRTRFQNSRVDFFKLVNDLNHSTQGREKNSASSFKSFITEYKEEKNSWAIAVLSGTDLNHSTTHPVLPVCDFTSIPKQPPRA